MTAKEYMQIWGHLETIGMLSVSASPITVIQLKSIDWDKHFFCNFKCCRGQATKYKLFSRARAFSQNGLKKSWPDQKEEARDPVWFPSPYPYYPPPASLSLFLPFLFFLSFSLSCSFDSLRQNTRNNRRQGRNLHSGWVRGAKNQAQLCTL